MNALKGPEIDDDRDQRILIGNGVTVSDFRSLNAQCPRLRIHPFGGGTLFGDRFVGCTMPVQLMAQAGADTGGHGGDTAAFFPIFMGKRAGCPCRCRILKGAGIAALFMRD